MGDSPYPSGVRRGWQGVVLDRPSPFFIFLSFGWTESVVQDAARRIPIHAPSSPTADELVAALRWVLVRECWRHTPDIATLSRRAGIPYEAPRRITAASRCMKTFPRRITSS
ncbi:MAG: hypothetical protein HS117_12465 [Verrucomicrobiaceae bacterium]|nr:hypothetical protein [Verrucomicrobiaceae bacterium]